MKRTVCVVAAWTALITLLITGAACEAAGVKIGIIDTQRIVAESKKAGAAREILVKELKEKQALFHKREGEVQALQEGLKEARGEGEAAEVKEKRDELARELKNLQRLKADLEEELNKRNRELTQELLREVAGVVGEYRKKHKFTVIFEKKSVVTFDEAVDITDEIIKRYDAERR